MGAPEPKFSSLTPSFQRLVRLMQSIGDGRIRHLHVHDGEPVFEPPPTAVRVLKLGRKSGGAPRSTPVPGEGREFALRRGVLELVAEMRGVKRGLVERIEVVGGLPLLVELAEPLAPTDPAGPTLTRTLVN